jgi:hypothetical protein
MRWPRAICGRVSQWIKTLDLISQAGYIDSILYTDLCNEWARRGLGSVRQASHDLRRLG